MYKVRFRCEYLGTYLVLENVCSVKRTGEDACVWKSLVLPLPEWNHRRVYGFDVGLGEKLRG